MPKSVERSLVHDTGEALPLPDKPSIAVLPFTNMSGDPEQEYFADGLTEDILTALTRFTQLTVIARNSTFVYKGRAVSIADIARDLGVRYVLEGSVRRSGERVRVTAQLIEAATSAHLWAERYDRAMNDIFALQDEITERIVTTLVSNIERSIIEQARRKPPGSLGAYELLLQGREQRNMSRHGACWPPRRCSSRRSRSIRTSRWRTRKSPISNTPCDLADRSGEAGRASRQGLCQRSSRTGARSVVAAGQPGSRQPAPPRPRTREAVTWAERAVALNPGEAESYAWLANVLSYVGRSAEALEQLAHARRLDPLHPPLWDFYTGRALLHLGRYEEALTWFEACSRRTPFLSNWRRYRPRRWRNWGGWTKRARPCRTRHSRNLCDHR